MFYPKVWPTRVISHTEGYSYDKTGQITAPGGYDLFMRLGGSKHATSQFFRSLHLKDVYWVMSLTLRRQGVSGRRAQNASCCLQCYVRCDSRLQTMSEIGPSAAQEIYAAGKRRQFHTNPRTRDHPHQSSIIVHDSDHAGRNSSPSCNVL